ncbi:hypothetical protein ONE63_003320 [Megalurothrips usitatus]|uniref:Protein neuralized n=1 Tax=Megalurothrips usitatus TaxID=439358 RepID=A0AAV7XBD9_9NEOP|nr:hypothetical protein ONE63_003320 [Megalurothrips usitatus]
MGATAMAFFNAVSGVTRQPVNPQPAAPPLQPPLGVGPVPGSRSARRHYQQHLQQLQLQQQQMLAPAKLAKGKQVVVAAPSAAAAAAGPSGPSAPSCSSAADDAVVVAQPPLPAPSRCPCTVDELLAPFKSKIRAFKKLKKRLATRSSGSTAPNNLPPLTFNPIHGENIELCFDRRVARRTESFCKAVTFSNRPVLVGEKVYIRFLEISDSWSGVIRMGFTSYDPVTLAASSSGLPRYACPDLTNKPGSWAKALSERFAVQGAVLYFYVTATGDVHFGVNGEDKGFFFGDVETRGPLWAVVDVYGNSTAIELVDPRGNLNNSRRSLTSGEWDSGSSPEHLAHSPALPAGMPGQHHHDQDVLPSPRFQPSGAVFSFLGFHRNRGRNVLLNADRTVATRPDTEFCHGYVFTQRPVVLGERIVVQVLNTEPAYVGALAFGLTSCDPANLSPSELPEDADFLLDRSEYWVVSKDVASAPQRGDELTFSVSHDGEVTISRNGSTPVVFMHVDHSLQLWAFMDVYGSTQRVRLLGSLMDPSLSLAAPSASSVHAHRSQGSSNQSSVDPHTANNTNNGRLSLGSACCSSSSASTAPAHTTGATAEVLQLAANGGTMLVVNLPPNPHTYLHGPPPAAAADADAAAASASTSFGENGHEQPSMQWVGQHAVNTMSGSECSICYERPIDSVLYMCGHMCMCFECAVQQWRGKGGGHCPMCRAVIRDVIRTYKS